MLAKTGNKIDAVAAANDGLGNAVVTALKAKKLDPIPVSGQDATAGGVQNIISGWQSGTVYKSIKLEADAAAALADHPHQGQRRQDERQDERRRSATCRRCLLKPDLDHEGELQRPLHGRASSRSPRSAAATYKQYCK